MTISLKDPSIPKSLEEDSTAHSNSSKQYFLEIIARLYIDKSATYLIDYVELDDKYNEEDSVSRRRA